MKKTVDVNAVTLEKEKNNFIKASKATYYFIEICRGIFAAFLILISIMIIGNFLGFFFKLFDFGNNSQRIVEMFVGGIYLLSYFIPLGFAAKIFDKFRKGQTPFQYDVADKIKGAAISMIVLNVVSQILGWVYAALINNNVFTGEMEIITVTNEIDIDTILYGILIYAFSYVFSYGAKLQQESDETL
ncbi:MAG: hypothetical protein J6A57_03445 [Ruminococcus sp.]|nr:hypothetical protein [Ruminococcus sp.]